MKKTIATALITALLLMPFNVNANITVSWKAKINSRNYYATNLMVKRIDRKKNKVYCKNWCGYPYQFYGVEDLEKGDIVACIMYTKGTSTIKDDRVISAKFERTDLLKQTNILKYLLERIVIIENDDLGDSFCLRFLRGGNSGGFVHSSFSRNQPFDAEIGEFARKTFDEVKSGLVASCENMGDAGHCHAE